MLTGREHYCSQTCLFLKTKTKTIWLPNPLHMVGWFYTILAVYSLYLYRKQKQFHNWLLPLYNTKNWQKLGCNFLHHPLNSLRVFQKTTQAKSTLSYFIQKFNNRFWNFSKSTDLHFIIINIHETNNMIINIHETIYNYIRQLMNKHVPTLTPPH